jgi:hypothetical protein
MGTPTEQSAAPQQTAITVLLTNSQTALMDEVAAGIRRNTGTSISRSAMLRTMISAMTPYFREWLHCGSEAELMQLITRRLQAGSVPQQPHQPDTRRPQVR